MIRPSGDSPPPDGQYFLIGKIGRFFIGSGR
jgi:hypothetical protein